MTVWSDGPVRSHVDAVISGCHDRELARIRSSMRYMALAERGTRPLQDHLWASTFPAISALARLRKELRDCPFGHGFVVTPLWIKPPRVPSQVLSPRTSSANMPG